MKNMRDNFSTRIQQVRGRRRNARHRKFTEVAVALSTCVESKLQPLFFFSAWRPLWQEH